MGKKILVADDEPDLVKLLEMRLKEHGYEVMTAKDGTSVLASVKAAPPDLMILDVAMPPPNGFQVARTMKDHEEWRNIPIILLTCKSTESDKFWGMESGADAYVTKPYHFDSLIKKVQELLQPSLR